MEHKRKRRNIDYKEFSASSADDASDKGNVMQANEWKRKTTNIMHIRVATQSIFKPALSDDDETYLSCITDSMWDGNIDIKQLPINGELKTLVRQVKLVHDAKNRLNETYIDTYINTLLHAMGFNFYPLSINILHKYQIKITDDELNIIAKPDFTVTSVESKMLIVVEDKTMTNATYANKWKEDQVMGEIFVAAHNLRIEEETELYAIRVIGTLFTFYKATVDINYIKETLRGYPIEEYMDVLRYPDPGEDIYEGVLKIHLKTLSKHL
ncbi:hypothetical protein Unana1_03849 [Umbelopsis nana]